MAATDPKKKPQPKPQPRPQPRPATSAPPAAAFDWSGLDAVPVEPAAPAQNNWVPPQDLDLDPVEQRGQMWQDFKSGMGELGQGALEGIAQGGAETAHTLGRGVHWMRQRARSLLGASPIPDFPSKESLSEVAPALFPPPEPPSSVFDFDTPSQGMRGAGRGIGRFAERSLEYMAPTGAIGRGERAVESMVRASPAMKGLSNSMTPGWRGVTERSIPGAIQLGSRAALESGGAASVAAAQGTDPETAAAWSAAVVGGSAPLRLLASHGLAPRIIYTMLGPKERHLKFGKPAEGMLEAGFSPSLGVLKTKLELTGNTLGRELDTVLAKYDTQLVDVRQVIVPPFRNAIRSPVHNIRGDLGTRQRLITTLQTNLLQLARSTNGTFMMTPAQLNAYKRDVGLSIGSFSDDVAEKKVGDVLQDLYRAVDHTVDSIAPEAKRLNERLANNITARHALVDRIDTITRSSLAPGWRSVATGGAVAASTAAGVGAYETENKWMRALLLSVPIALGARALSTSSATASAKLLRKLYPVYEPSLSGAAGAGANAAQPPPYATPGTWNLSPTGTALATSPGPGGAGGAAGAGVGGGGGAGPRGVWVPRPSWANPPPSLSIGPSQQSQLGGAPPGVATQPALHPAPLPTVRGPVNVPASGRTPYTGPGDAYSPLPLPSAPAYPQIAGQAPSRLALPPMPGAPLEMPGGGILMRGQIMGEAGGIGPGRVATITPTPVAAPAPMIASPSKPAPAGRPVALGAVGPVAVPSPPPPVTTGKAPKRAKAPKRVAASPPPPEVTVPPDAPDWRRNFMSSLADLKKRKAPKP